MHLKIKRGLNIPIQGRATGRVQTLPAPQTLALDLDPFYFLRFSLLKKPGDKVRVGEPLAEDRAHPGRVFVSPASGTLKEIVRGLKRRILRLIISSDQSNLYFDHPPFQSHSKDELLSYLMRGGLFPHIRVRPCERCPTLTSIPDAIFVKALDSAPFAPPPELEIEGYESFFQHGLTHLSTLCPVHLVYHVKSNCLAFQKAKDVNQHTAEGPHPISCPSLHIEAIRPIRENRETVWTLTVHDVIAIGYLLKEGKYYHERVISLAGMGIPEHKRGFFRISKGFPIRDLIPGDVDLKSTTLISGDPLMGTKVKCDDYLKFFDTVCCALPKLGEKRRFCHFTRPISKRYTMTSAYFKSKKLDSFTTLQHGEQRPFIDGVIYEKVTPLKIPLMQLIKAILAEDFELAKSIGLLSIAPEDFALPAFICPSKIEMPTIVLQGLRAYAKQYLD